MYPETEFSNIQFDVKRQDVVRIRNDEKLTIDNYLETVMNSIDNVRTIQVGDDVICENSDPNWDVTTFLSETQQVNLDSVAELGNDLQIYFTQDSGWTTEISYTVKRWSM